MHTSDLNFYRPSTRPAATAQSELTQLTDKVIPYSERYPQCEGSVPVSSGTGENARRCGNRTDGVDYLCVTCREAAE